MVTRPRGPARGVVEELAAAFGVATGYEDWRGWQVRVGTGTLVSVLAAFGVDATTTAAARRALHQVRDARWRRAVPPVVVARAGSPITLPVRAPEGESVRVWVELEDGGERHDAISDTARPVPAGVGRVPLAETVFRLPRDLPLGWHRVLVSWSARQEATALVVVPACLSLPPALRDRRTWGFMTQVYAIRSRRSWGIGDLADLADLASWSARSLGAGFVLVNPLHAAEPVAPVEPSPYLPTTRRFVNPLYLRVEQIPEFAYLPAADRARVAKLSAGPCARDTTGDLLDRDGAWAAKREVLELVYRVPRTPGRQAAYAVFLEREGEGLADFATWCALAERHGPLWRRWPTALRDPRSAAVTAARDELGDRVDFHRWLQWVLDEQLAGAQRAAHEAGMPLGVVHDLAVGVHAEGADTWAHQDVFAHGISAGAPPDEFNQQGQVWSQPPWRPDRLADAAYGPYRDMLCTVFRHAGGLRVDHVMGLFRLWWVPAGDTAAEGTYVRYDHEAMVGILALEAHRAGALVVGEDLGTVERWVRDHLRERGLLGTSVLWFERDRNSSETDGKPRRPDQWREACLATMTTHDLPPAAAVLTGEHVRLRDQLGLLEQPFAEELTVAEEELREWLSLLTEMGLLRPGAGEQETVEAFHRFLTWTPCRLLGVSLGDAVGDHRLHNQPGTTDEYPNWRLPLTGPDGRPLTLEDITRSSRVRSLARVLLSRVLP